MCIWATQIGIFGGWAEGSRVGGWIWVEWEVSVIGVYCMKFPNSQISRNVLLENNTFSPNSAYFSKMRKTEIHNYC